MNLENIYSILDRKLQDDQTLWVRLQINKEHPIFKAHFPDHPVLPGVALLQISKELSEAHKQTSLFMKTASRVKFINLVNPKINNQLIIILTFHEEEGLLKVKNSTTFVDETPVMHCVLTFQK